MPTTVSDLPVTSAVILCLKIRTLLRSLQNVTANSALRRILGFISLQMLPNDRGRRKSLTPFTALDLTLAVADGNESFTIYRCQHHMAQNYISGIFSRPW